MFQAKRGSLRDGLLLFHFSARVDFSVPRRSVVVHVWQWLCPQTRGRGAREGHHNTRNIPSRDWLKRLSSLSTPPALPSICFSWVSSFSTASSSEVKRSVIAVLCGFFFCHYFFVLLFRRDIVFWCWSCFLCCAMAALQSAFCCRGWVVGWGRRKEKRARDWGGFLKQWFQTRGWRPSRGPEINLRSYNVHFCKLKFVFFCVELGVETWSRNKRSRHPDIIVSWVRSANLQRKICLVMTITWYEVKALEEDWLLLPQHHSSPFFFSLGSQAGRGRSLGSGYTLDMWPVHHRENRDNHTFAFSSSVSSTALSSNACLPKESLIYFSLAKYHPEPF